ncbi:hypothetical protein IVG45_03050 [Methylomonas sp. LL1]|uniref:hypothetical protein n=1 Tax=Methylomonas sp. LL1 TaxID=2785785 RepID=UPI0018C448B4|nr:hypothetical protein [Methylomonas sp. LL1]QPK63973.1 hypothetical protein IVG45_03050 [Methylomonas sp. LL1]
MIKIGLKPLLAGLALASASIPASAAVFTFQTMPGGVNGHPETIGTAGNDCTNGGVCYVTAGTGGLAGEEIAFGAISVPNTSLEHIHGENADSDADKELNYHADAGGWRAQAANGTSKINLTSWIQATIGDTDVNDETGEAPKDYFGDLIVEAVGGASSGYQFHISQSTAWGSTINFGSQFQGIDAFLVYFEGLKGIVPTPLSAEDGFFAAIDNANISIAATAPVPVPGALYLFGSALIGLIGFGRKNQTLAG